MPMTAGARLGPYEIVAPLGAGGMGEVYRARDTRLGRDVAVKVLPQHLSANPEVRARFEREAKTVSSLAHPNICTLFDVGREGPVDYLVMELVDGETLAQRLARGPLGPGEVLKIGAQIADALDRAHRAGVVHRDLKPGNVMLTRAGAKLMDFGLARATGLAPAMAGSGSLPGSLTQSPTIAAPLTAEGTLIGTFQYMAPEQLEGKEADERSDLWALGCVLYEMATGRRAFEGRSQASLITAIMGTEPPPVSQVAPLAPAGLDRLVRTCLTKDPEDRARSAHDVKLQLLGMAEGPSSASVVVPGVARRSSSARLPWAIAAIATVVALALAAVTIVRGTAPRRAVQLALVAPPQVSFTPYMLATLSPDGQSIAFCAADSSRRRFSIFVQRLDEPEPTMIGGTAGYGMVFWSPDGRNLGFLEQGAGQLSTLPVSGGTPVRLCSVSGPRGGAWSPRGAILFSRQTQGPLYRISPAGGDPVAVTVLDSTRHETGHRFPCFLPDGDHFLYTALPGGPNGFDIFAGSLSSRTVKKVMTAGSSVVYAEPGYLLFRRAGKVMAQRFDARSFRLSGEPVAIADAPPESDMDAEPVATASHDRVAVLVADEPDTELGWLDRSGAVRERLSLPAGKWTGLALSPDDRAAIVEKGLDLWRVDLARSVALRVTTGDGLSADPVWSPDGSQIAYRNTATGKEEILVANSDGSGEPRLLKTTPDQFKNPTDWTSAGLVIASISPVTFRDLDLVPPGGGPVKPLVATRFGEGEGRVSPDGRWMAYTSNEGGVQDLYVQSFPDGRHKIRATTGGASAASWVGNGELVVRTLGNDACSVALTPDGEGLAAGPPRTLFHFPEEVQHACPTHDGRSYLVTLAVARQRERIFRVILDWTALLGH